MSVATWKCDDCGGEGYHFNLCPRLWRDPREAEIAALRAALDQERADCAKLRAFAQDCEALWLNGGVDVLSLGDMLHRHKLIAGPTGNPTALLSGRGEAKAPSPAPEPRPSGT